MTAETDAERAFRAALEREPQSRTALEGLAALLLARGAHGEAAELLGRALAPQTGNPDAMERLARLRLAQGDQTGAATALAACLATEPTRPAALYLRAILEIQRRDYGQAVTSLRAALAAAPAYNEARRQLGLLLGALGQVREALPVLLAAAESLPDDADVAHAAGHAHLQLQQPAAAEPFFRRALALRPHWEEATLNLVTVLVRLHRAGEAETLLASLPETARETSRALGLRASILEAQNRIGQARQALERALRQAPDDLETLFRLGILALGQGDVAAALEPLQRAAALAPAEHAIQVNLANTLLGLKRLDGAAAAAEAAVTLAPRDAVALNTLGTVREAQDRPEEAAEAFRRALAADPGQFAARFNLARALRKAGDLDEAKSAARAVCAAWPSDWRTHDVLASVLAAAGDLVGAEDSHRNAIALAPPGGDAFANYVSFLMRQRRYADILVLADATPQGGRHALLARAMALQGLHRDDEVIPIAGQLLAGDPQDVPVLTVLAEALHSLRQLADEARVLGQIVAAQPDNAAVRARLIDARLSLCDWTDYGAFCTGLRAQVETEMQAGAAVSIDLFNLQALPVDLAFVAAVARSKALAIGARERAKPPAASPPPRGGRVRVGYALAYTHFHSLPLVLKEVIERHDRGRLEVFGYSLGADDGSPFSRDYRAAFDGFADIGALPAAQAAARIRGDRLDLLIDVTGHTSINCMAAMAHRPAPVQAHFLGYSITTGADYIDYLITDARYMPPDAATLCTEKLVTLPDTFMATVRAPIASRRPTRAELGLPADAFVLANFNHPCKFDPESFACWMQVLAAVPRAVLWFGDWFPDTRANLRAAAAARGIDPGRLIFAPILRHPDHLARLACADLAVDNLVHGGGITSVDALWAGVPLISVPGRLPGGRLGLTLLTAAGLPELVQPSPEAYVAEIVALAGDPARCAAHRAKVAAARNSALFDQAAYTRHLDDAIVAMAEIYRRGEAPRAIAVPRCA